jgi:hypothetical protein
MSSNKVSDDWLENHKQGYGLISEVVRELIGARQKLGKTKVPYNISPPITVGFGDKNFSTVQEVADLIAKKEPTIDPLKLKKLAIKLESLKEYLKESSEEMKKIILKVFDNEIHQALGWDNSFYYNSIKGKTNNFIWSHGSQVLDSFDMDLAYSYTTNFSAALALFPNKVYWSLVCHQHDSYEVIVTLENRTLAISAETPAIAMCILALRGLCDHYSKKEI